MGNMQVHHSKQVKAWVYERTQHIELFYLPSYSLQLNPEEWINAGLTLSIGNMSLNAQ